MYEMMIVVETLFYPRLLKDDFGQPDAVWVVGVAPW
jgi:hypothetical protein